MPITHEFKVSFRGYMRAATVRPFRCRKFLDMLLKMVQKFASLINVKEKLRHDLSKTLGENQDSTTGYSLIYCGTTSQQNFVILDIPKGIFHLVFFRKLDLEPITSFRAAFFKAIFLTVFRTLSNILLEIFAKIINSFQLLTIFEKISIVQV